MERSKLWRNAFRANQGFLELNLEGYTDEIAARRPGPGSASPAWILSHLIHARRGIMALLGSPAPPDEGLGKEGHRGGDGQSVSLPFRELLARFQAMDEPLKQACMAVADWDKPTKNPGVGVEQPLEQVIAFMSTHEAYHIGQIAYARKFLGLGAVIQ